MLLSFLCIVHFSANIKTNLFCNLQDCQQWSEGQRRMAALLLRTTRKKISLLSSMISSRTLCVEIGRTALTGKVTNRCKSYRVISEKVNKVLSYQFLIISSDGKQYLMYSVGWILKYCSSLCQCYYCNLYRQYLW